MNVRTISIGVKSKVIKLNFTFYNTCVIIVIIQVLFIRTLILTVVQLNRVFNFIKNKSYTKMYHILIRKELLNMKTVLIVGANGRVSIEATKIFLENSRFNVDLFLRNAHRIPDYASNRIKVYEETLKILRI